jgi:hypothetical protein
MELHLRGQWTGRNVIVVLQHRPMVLQIGNLVKPLHYSADSVACCCESVLLTEANARTAAVEVSLSKMK